MNYNKIKLLLTERGKSLPQLANDIGMSKAGLYLAIEKNRLTVENLEKIAEAFNVSISEFFETSNQIGRIKELSQELRMFVPFPVEISSIGDLENYISELKKHLLSLEDKLQTRQAIISLVLYQLKTIIARNNNLLLEKGELTKLGYENVEQFMNETIEGLNLILDAVKSSSAYYGDISYRQVKDSGPASESKNDIVTAITSNNDTHSSADRKSEKSSK